MSKKTMITIGAIALVAVAVVAAFALTSNDTPGSDTSNSTGSGSTNVSTTSTGTSAPGTTATGTASTNTTSGNKPGSTTSGAQSGSGSTTALKPFPPLPASDAPAQKPANTAAPGAALVPLTEAPSDTISALKVGTIPDGAHYTIVMRPYGIGPSVLMGSRVAIRVDKSTPVGNSPVENSMSNSNVLVVVNTTDGGTVTKGGTYTATLTFRSDGSKMLPILSNVKAQN